MSRAALAVLLAALAPAACQVMLRFDPPDGSASRDATGVQDAPATHGCARDQDCPLPSLHCDPSSGQCLACVSDGNCASTAGRPRCDPALNVCVQCVGDLDCPAPGKCIRATQSCVKTCTASSDCGSGTIYCDDGLCAQCDDDFHCTGAHSYCDRAKDQCVGCFSDTQCAGDAAAPHCNRTIGACVGCLTGSDCPAGMACDPTDWSCKPPAR